jgi:hypothetical protein
MSGKLYGDGGLECLAEVPLWQRHLECALSIPVYAVLAYTGYGRIESSIIQAMDGISRSKYPQHFRSDAWLAVLLAFVLGWEFVCVCNSFSRVPYYLPQILTRVMQVQAPSWLFDLLHQPVPPHDCRPNLPPRLPHLAPQPHCILFFYKLCIRPTHGIRFSCSQHANHPRRTSSLLGAGKLPPLSDSLLVFSLLMLLHIC